MSYTHQVHFTKNMLDGALKGCQLHSILKMPSAARAAQVALELQGAGILRDVFTGDPFTAHNVDIVSFEPELPELVEESAGWTAFEAADFAYDLRGDH